ncbi:monoheme cytochrome C [Desulfuromonas soudanensis]|uniref:Monoheme cytochrome C n=1 Tax=Desulfuromonas soudanensis TaxID=1603606 RepID=A0A0M4DES3_9BACT|nr:cytochrome c [Desulfuromonas soudanensis]ALC14882.1 monoheme cytochrome C [Desulfuromonas soudanensis]
MSLSSTALGLLLLITFVAGCSDLVPDYPRREPPAGLLGDAARQEAGAALFSLHCAVCHGTPEEGRTPRADFFVPPAPDFTSATYRSADPAYLFWRIQKGKAVEPYLSGGSVMPAWGPHLSDEELWSLVAYILRRSGS